MCVETQFTERKKMNTLLKEYINLYNEMKNNDKNCIHYVQPKRIFQNL